MRTMELNLHANVVRHVALRQEKLAASHFLPFKDWAFDDGAAPPKTVVEDWLNLIKARFHDKNGSCIAVHCVAGLGRAPVLVAIALIEAGMKFEDAVDLIRRQRRGAINAIQLSYLEKYKPARRLKVKEPNGCCVQ